jgi:UDP-N-acetylglucosamine--N-acetylmuramyl-(pentapeptide) pyrophosphoryl-undecaprenol N-acetylglucosamine transferase
MKILFVVCGEGLGHSSRCIHLGNYLQQQGHIIHFAAYGKSFDFISQQGVTNLHRTPREVYLEGENGFFSLKKTLWSSKWIIPDLIRSFLNIMWLIRDHRFDCVVCDTMYGGVLAARFEKTPVVFITNQTHFNGLDGTTNLIWITLNFFIVRYIHLSDRIIVPDYPAPETVSEYNIIIPKGEEHRYIYTGPFFELDPALYSCGRETIFTSFGGEPYKLPMYMMLKEIADRRKDLFFDVFYTGAALPESSDNFVSHGYVPDLYKHLAQAKIAIVHGGLTTLHEAMLFEKPVLIIMDPYHPEQQNNAKKIVDLGAGTSVNGRLVTIEVLENKIAETMACYPRPVRDLCEATGGRKNAARIIIDVAGRRQS